MAYFRGNDDFESNHKLYPLSMLCPNLFKNDESVMQQGCFTIRAIVLNACHLHCQFVHCLSRRRHHQSDW
jgi:hypothetical protein